MEDRHEWKALAAPVAWVLLAAAVLVVAGGVVAGIALGPKTSAGNFDVFGGPTLRARLEVMVQPLNPYTALLVLLAVLVARGLRGASRSVLERTGGVVAGILFAAGAYGVVDAFAPPRGYLITSWQKYLLAAPRAAMLLLAAVTTWIAFRPGASATPSATDDDLPVPIEMQ